MASYGLLLIGFVMLFVLPSTVKTGPLLYGASMAACIGGLESGLAIAAAFLTGGIGAVIALTGAAPEVVAGCAALCAPLLLIPGF
ncbi:unnamed protein product [Rotaria socialis]|uniref:Uncharacterized protein n=1 Tax=Rotaria socialis TaxID=392032 RepID=A0A821ISY8_9BILA|nr:unnamed protein product [Rotaria socialis]CAF3575210.1 unnamed protein product [Rotaria socialis]CAF4376772.1 unnamed protein product [Rotaria socialis]CAF4457284.1 unnamed protein product [Rotaria socialis]CAF4707203.1 unnamed protein product [Rotaria socialis]